MRSFFKYFALCFAVLLFGQAPIRGQSIGEHLVAGLRSAWQWGERAWEGSRLHRTLTGSRPKREAAPKRLGKGEVTRELIKDTEKTAPPAKVSTRSRGYDDPLSGEKMTAEDQETLRRLLAN